MSKPTHITMPEIRARMVRCSCSAYDAWFEYFSIGGTCSAFELEAALHDA